MRVGDFTAQPPRSELCARYGSVRWRHAAGCALALYSYTDLPAAHVRKHLLHVTCACPCQRHRTYANTSTAPTMPCLPRAPSTALRAIRPVVLPSSCCSAHLGRAARLTPRLTPRLAPRLTPRHAPRLAPRPTLRLPRSSCRLVCLRLASLHRCHIAS